MRKVRVMGVFEFVLILVFLVVIVEAGTKLLLPVSRRMADLIGATAEEKRRAQRAPTALPDDALEEIEDRLARIEDRLGFLEELRAPTKKARLGTGPVEDEDQR